MYTRKYFVQAALLLGNPGWQPVANFREFFHLHPWCQQDCGRSLLSTTALFFSIFFYSKKFTLLQEVVGVGDGGRGARTKFKKKYFSGNYYYYVKFGYFSGKNHDHVKYGNFVNFSGKYHKHSGILIIIRARIM